MLAVQLFNIQDFMTAEAMALQALDAKYRKSLGRQFRAILVYFRLHGLRCVTAARIAREFGLQEHGDVVRIGQALTILAIEGFFEVVRRKPRLYRPTPKLYVWVQHYGCLKPDVCRKCPLHGKPACPFAAR